jgi:hypothetical protein
MRGSHPLTRRKCCAHLPYEERAKRDSVTFGALCSSGVKFKTLHMYIIISLQNGTEFKFKLTNKERMLLDLLFVNKTGRLWIWSVVCLRSCMIACVLIIKFIGGFLKLFCDWSNSWLWITCRGWNAIGGFCNLVSRVSEMHGPDRGYAVNRNNEHQCQADSG